MTLVEGRSFVESSADEDVITIDDGEEVRGLRTVARDFQPIRTYCVHKKKFTFSKATRACAIIITETLVHVQHACGKNLSLICNVRPKLHYEIIELIGANDEVGCVRMDIVFLQQKFVNFMFRNRQTVPLSEVVEKHFGIPLSGYFPIF